MVRVYSSYSLWSEIISGVPQGSILGPLRFNVYLADFFRFMTGENIANYADDSTPYESYIEMVIQKLQNNSLKLFLWFSQNKSHLLFSCKDLNLSAIIDGEVIPNENNEIARCHV